MLRVLVGIFPGHGMQNVDLLVAHQRQLDARVLLFSQRAGSVRRRGTILIGIPFVTLQNLRRVVELPLCNKPGYGLFRVGSEEECGQGQGQGQGEYKSWGNRRYCIESWGDMTMNLLTIYISGLLIREVLA